MIVNEISLVIKNIRVLMSYFPEEDFTVELILCQLMHQEPNNQIKDLMFIGGMDYLILFLGGGSKH